MDAMARPTKQLQADTAARILDVAEEMVQVRGFNSFSYADIAAEIGVTTASLHYHFPSKADLGRALIERYSERFFGALSEIEVESDDALTRLRAYAQIYGSVLQEQRLCLCGMLAAEFTTLPGPMRDAVLSFFSRNESWLKDVLEEGQARGEIRHLDSTSETAQMIVSVLEGAMLIARPTGDVSRLTTAANQLLAGLDSGAVPA